MKSSDLNGHLLARKQNHSPADVYDCAMSRDVGHTSADNGGIIMNPESASGATILSEVSFRVVGCVQHCPSDYRQLDEKGQISTEFLLTRAP